MKLCTLINFNFSAKCTKTYTDMTVLIGKKVKKVSSISQSGCISECRERRLLNEVEQENIVDVDGFEE